MVTKESKLVILDRFFRQRNRIWGKEIEQNFLYASVHCLVCFVAYSRIISLWLQNAVFCDAFEVHQNH